MITEPRPLPPCSRTVIAAATTIASIVLSACNGVEIQDQMVTATGRVTGTDGTGAPAQPVALTLTHDPGVSSPRVVVASGGLQNVTGLEVAVQRTGIPLAESFVLLNISQPTLQPEGNDPNASVAGGADSTFVRRNIGDLAENVVDTALLDAPLSHTVGGLPPAVPAGELSPVRTAGTTVFARIEEDDFRLPFSDPSLLIDVQRLATIFFDALSDAVTGAAAAPGAAFRPAGADGAGSFRMFFVPHATHSVVTLPERNVKGFALIFAATIDVLDPLAGLVPLGTADVYVPISLLFEPSTSSEAPFAIFADPFSMIGSTAFPPDNLERVLVVARGILPDQLAGTVRTAIVGAISSMPQTALDQIEDGLELLAAVLDATIPETMDVVPDDFDVVLVPETTPADLVSNQLLPAASGTPVRLFFLQ